MRLDLPEDGILRVLCDLTAQELRAQKIDVAETALNADTHIDESGLDLDSLQRLDLASAVNQFFQLYETGIEDYLMTQPSLQGWADVVAHALREGTSGVTFLSSGSQGAPKPCGHLTVDLHAELDALRSTLGPPSRIVSLVPSHHIYGFLFTVLAPARWHIPVVDARPLSPGALRSTLSEGDMIVAVPTLWRYLVRSLGPLPPGVSGLSATAPLPDALWASLDGLGLQRLVEIYGATETGGIGWRDQSGEGFRLIETVVARGFAEGAPVLRRARDGAPLEIMDNLEWLAHHRFRPVGRKDKAIQIGGHNVFPQRIAAALAGHSAVQECVVRPDDQAPEPRLKAFIVPEDKITEDEAREALSEWCRRNLKPAERPVTFTFGETLPMSPLGKPADWPEAMT